MNIYTNRLINEWKTHDKIIIALDFDDTSRTFTLDTPTTFKRVLDDIRTAQAIGAWVICNTASKPERYGEIMEFYENEGITIDAINSMPNESFTYGYEGKVFANIYLDDRAGLNEALEILEKAIDSKLKKNESISNR